MRRQWRAVLGLSLCAATVASAGLVTPQLLSQKQKDECQLETQRLYHCSTFTAPDSPLTDHQRDLCCEALQTFNKDNCFWWVVKCLAATKNTFNVSVSPNICSPLQAVLC